MDCAVIRVTRKGKRRYLARVYWPAGQLLSGYPITYERWLNREGLVVDRPVYFTRRAQATHALALAALLDWKEAE